MACFANPDKLEEEFLGISVPGLAYVCEDDFLVDGVLVAGVAKGKVGVGVWEVEEGDGAGGVGRR